MKNKLNITDGKLSMTFPTSSLQLIYAKSNEIIAYFKGVNDKTVRVTLDINELKTNEDFNALEPSGLSSWVFDELCEKYGEMRVKKIEVWNSSGSATNL